MRSIPVALKTHLSGESATPATLWKVTLTADSPPTVLGFTDHDEDIPFDDGDGEVIYAAETGFTRTDIASADDLSVDNMEVDGVLVSPSITEDDLRIGRWDAAAIKVMLVNWADLTMGCMIMRVGKLGEVTLNRNSFVAELRGLTQAYTRTIGELTQPGCRAELGDARCKVDLAPFTVDGTLDAVGVDKLTYYDAARTEDGPTGGLDITAITNANPGQVTVDDGSTLSNGMAVVLSDIVGPTLLNTITVVRNLSGNTFDLSIDTSDTGDFPAYVGSGKVTPLGGDSGYFDYGVMTMTSGVAEGHAMEVKSHVPGQWHLQMPLAGGLLTPSAGDTYRMKAGCDKSLSTCKNKFANVVNMRAEPYLPGIDRLAQIGKQK